MVGKINSMSKKDIYETCLYWMRHSHIVCALCFVMCPTLLQASDALGAQDPTDVDEPPAAVRPFNSPPVELRRRPFGVRRGAALPGVDGNREGSDTDETAKALLPAEVPSDEPAAAASAGASSASIADSEDTAASASTPAATREAKNAEFKALMASPKGRRAINFTHALPEDVRLRFLIKEAAKAGSAEEIAAAISELPEELRAKFSAAESVVSPTKELQERLMLAIKRELSKIREEGDAIGTETLPATAKNTSCGCWCCTQ